MVFLMINNSCAVVWSAFDAINCVHSQTSAGVFTLIYCISSLVSLLSYCVIHFCIGPVEDSNLSSGNLLTVSYLDVRTRVLLNVEILYQSIVCGFDNKWRLVSSYLFWNETLPSPKESSTCNFTRTFKLSSRWSYVTHGSALALRIPSRSTWFSSYAQCHCILESGIMYNGWITGKTNSSPRPSYVCAVI